MDSNAVLVEYDVLSPFGRGLDPLWRALLERRSAFADIPRFDTTAFACRQAALVPNGTEAVVPEREPLDGDSLVIRMLRRLLPPATPFPADTLLLLATTVGEIDELEHDALVGGSDPLAGAPERLLERARALCGLTGPARLVSAACASSTVALAEAASMIRAGECEAALVVACDAVTEFVFSGFSTLMALDPDGARPFDVRRKGLMLGEAATWALVMSEQRARRERRPIAATIAGYGASNDANHMTGPSRDGAGLARAIRQALRSAGQTPDAIAAIHAHGTGTAYNDAMEMKAFRAVFHDKPRPVFSVKGAVGHTLGAAGLLETLVALRCLEEHTVPPTVGLEQPDPLALGWVSDQAVPLTNGRALLTTNSGFGGINAALILQTENR